MRWNRLYFGWHVFSCATFAGSFCLIIFLSACSSDDVTKITKSELGGFVQKGPYLNGTSITISELTQNLNATGLNFTTQISDNTGTFSIENITLESEFVELRADGFYFNEVEGANSSAQLTMFAIADITSATGININILSHLESNRVKKLSNDGLSFAEAKDQAQSEVMDIFGFQVTGVENSEKLDISKAGEGNRILLAISVILQANRSVADLAELLANISTDITDDGVLDNLSLRADLASKVQYVDLTEVRQNLEARYAELGVSASIGDFETLVNNYVANEVPFQVNYVVRDACFESFNGLIDLSFTHNTQSEWWPASIIWTMSEGHADHCMYSWQSPITMSDGAATMEMLCQGIYTVEITDEDGYSIVKKIHVSEAQSPISISTDIDHNNTLMGSSGAIDITVSAGTPPYNYDWSNGAVTEDISGLAVGVYDLEITDANMCSFSTKIPVYFSFTDQRDSQDYFAIIIGSQVWMANNMNIGTRIAANIDQTDNGTIEKYCYDDDEAMCDNYGGLYNPTETNQYSGMSGTQGICPDGWHIPTDDEWKTLELYLGMNSSDVELIDWDARGTIEGDLLKLNNCSGNSGDRCGETGFAAKLAGHRNGLQEYDFIDAYAHFWSSTTDGTTFLMRRISQGGTIGRQEIPNSFAYSVRCIMD